ncbi:MAG TPA: Rieske 2Fe-2S domain-containing protein [Gaiellaceae bacterium]|nr:Rieske 2Fe-2S domain-containing protein [Gaiellaceae bacterium]
MEPHNGDDKPHLPSPSIWPVGFAVGIACMLAGIVVSTPAVIVGAVIALVFGALWARDAMRPTQAPSQPDQVETAMAEPEPEEVNRFPRDQFLELTTLGIAGVITAVVALPVVGFAILPAFTKQKRQGVDLGPTDNFPENEWIEATFLLDPSVGEVSRRTAFVRYNGVFEDLPSYTLISNRCVHLGCPVQAAGPRREDARKTVDTEQAEIALTPVLPAAYSCPCHGGAYDTEGNRTAGPPVRAMDRFKFEIDNGRLILLDTFSVAKVEGEGAQAKLEAYGIQGPGEHVDGLEGWLYPIQPQDLR